MSESQPTLAEQVWNRAATDFGGSAAREGDRALADLLIAHGTVMNGGVGHAIDALSSDALSAAAAGYRFFGFEGVARLLENASTAGADELDQLEHTYAELVPSDRALVEHFEAFYLSSAEAFAPIEQSAAKPPDRRLICWNGDC